MFKNLSLKEIGLNVSMREGARLAKIGKFEGMDLKIEEAVELTENFSFSYVEGIFASFNIKIGGWRIPFKWDGSEKEYEEGIEKLKKFAEIAGKLRAFRTYTSICPFSDHLPYDENFQFHVKRLKKIAEILKENGCSLGLEFIGTPSMRKNHKYQFIHSLQEILELREKIGLENVGVLLDSWHLFTSKTHFSFIKNLKKTDIVYVHVSDAPKEIPVEEFENDKRYLPGETGVINLVEFLKFLKEIEYDGPVTPEPFNEKVNKLPPEIAVRLTGGYLSNLFQKVFKEK